MTDLLLRLFVKDYRNIQDRKVRERYGLFASFFGLITNFILFVSKIVIGSILHLNSVVSDSVNSLSDFGNNFLSILGLKMGSKKADKEHPYGHERMEYVISLIIGCTILILGAIMFYQSVLDIVSFFQTVIETGEPPVKEFTYVLYVVTLSILSFSIFLKLLQSYVYFSLGKRIDSLTLKSLGKDSRNDVFSTILTIIGVLITWFTGSDVDGFFALVLSVLLVSSGFSIIKEAGNEILGEKPKKEMIESIVRLILSHHGVLGIHDLNIHSYGQEVYAVIHVEVDANKDIMESHELIDSIEREAMEKLRIHLTIHMDPILLNDKETLEYKECVEEVLRSLPYPVTMHDFRIVTTSLHVTLLFDLVLPKELDDEKSKKEITEKILKASDHRYGKEVSLTIDFDSKDTDLLSDTKVEEK